MTTEKKKQGRGKKQEEPILDEVLLSSVLEPAQELEPEQRPADLPEVTDPGAIQAALCVSANMYIYNEIESAATSYFKIGYKLMEVRDQKLFKVADFQNVYEYAEVLFGFKKSSVANFIAVCDRFGLRDADGRPTEQVNPKYAAFKFSQLTLMVSLTDAEIAQIKPEMTYREIQSIKKLAAPAEDNEKSKKTKKDPSDFKPGDVLYNGFITKETWDRILENLFQLLEKDCKVQISIN